MKQKNNKKNIILSGDSGGTKTELALFEKKNGKLEKITSQKYFNKDFLSFEDIVQAFLKNKNSKIEFACIGIAGPVIDGKCKSTNFNWKFDEKILSKNLKIKKFKLANDLEAVAEAVTLQDKNNLITLYPGDGLNKAGHKVILSPGTGLGQAALIYADGKYNVIATEGGHTDFAPSNEIEIELLKYMKKKFEHVSYDRIASGMGLVDIFNFLQDTNYDKADDKLLERLKIEDAAAVISEEGLKKQNKICEKTLDIFSSVLGAQAGNMVLNYKAIGGVYLAGRIPLLNIDKLKDGTFLKSYLNKGRLTHLVEMTPVYVIPDSAIGLVGAAILAIK